ncbi:aspartate aminotransferase family protein [Niveispirillum fermenti]|uniref:aspartate aminotransferase family protein n=1 Tax=Niveispirillum fermenti TaxID=1233113 RepID=UPI003A85E5F3
MADSALMNTYARLDVAFDRGEGAWLMASDGRRFLDFAAGIGVNGLGHAHPALVAALTAQAGRLWHCSNNYRIPGQEAVARTLTDHSFAQTVFFCNSGAEALEAALKLARYTQKKRGQPERWRTITFEGAFHGRTLATVTAGGQPKYVNGFEPLVDGFDRARFNDLASVEAAIGPQTAAILLEPVMGEGGIRVAEAGFLRGLRTLCDRHGLLLLLDEVQTGIGRTGRLFAHEWAFDAPGLRPDIVAVAKGLGGGFPVGACLAAGDAAHAFAPGAHGTTFGGNPLAMAVAGAVLEQVLAPGFLEQVRQTGALLERRLSNLQAAFPTLMTGVRGIGLMRGLHLTIPPADLVRAAFAEGLLLVGAGDNVVRLLPPLIIGQTEVEAAMDKLFTALSTLMRVTSPLPARV